MLLSSGLYYFAIMALMLPEVKDCALSLTPYFYIFVEHYLYSDWCNYS